MIQVFCNKPGAGKTKKLIELANTHLDEIKGDSLYIDSSLKHIIHLDKKIRFIATKEFGISNCNTLYGMICGALAGNFDIENIYIDSVIPMRENNLGEIYDLLEKLRSLSNSFDLNIFLTLNYDKEDDLPEFLKKYVA